MAKKKKTASKKSTATKKSTYQKEVEGLLKGVFAIPCSGVITMNNWTMAPDGETYLYFFSPRWKIVTDGMWPLPNFRSAEKWQAIPANADGEALAILPGCGVKALLVCAAAPKIKGVYSFR